VLHLVAIAGRVGIDLELDWLDEIFRATPVVGDVRPTGAHLVEDLHAAGGIPAVLTALQPLLELDAITVTGKPLAAAMAPATGDAVTSIDDPVTPAGGLAVLRGNLAPRGALIKVGAADPALLEHRGPAVVFDGMDDMLARIDDEDLPVTGDSVLVLRGVGPKGVPGMPEWGQIPVPRKLLAQGVTDMVRLSDARMSGTAFGTVVLHVAPEAAADGPLRLVRDGDQIALSARDRTLTLDVPDAEPAWGARLTSAPPV
jgi:dihydroxyacid dehydratase/phosphogluconate dehydratase